MHDEDQIQYRVLSGTSRRARKSYICDFCRRAIEPGERYFCVAAIYEGNFEYRRSHDPYGRCVERLDDGQEGR